MNDTEAEIDALYECPLALTKIETPAITPSGNTVELLFLEELIKKSHNKVAKDPFDRNLTFKKTTVNRFAT